MRTPQLRIGDVVDDLIVIEKRFHPITRRIECLCQRTTGALEGVYICLWTHIITPPQRRDFALAGRRMREMADQSYRAFKRARKSESKAMHHEWFMRRMKRVGWFERLARTWGEQGRDAQGGGR